MDREHNNCWDTEKFPNLAGSDPVTDLKVMQSAAGFYIGRSYWDIDGEFEGPYSRESGYYPTEDLASSELAGGFRVRDCVENAAAYASGALPDPNTQDVRVCNHKFVTDINHGKLCFWCRIPEGSAT